jgi:hypothetical protein
MSRLRKNTLLRWGPTIIFVGILCMVFFDRIGLFGNNRAQLKITNLATIDLAEIQVQLHEKQCQIEHLNPGESSLCSFTITADAHHVISWKETDSIIYREAAGYVTPGFDVSNELKFLGNGKVNFEVIDNI